MRDLEKEYGDDVTGASVFKGFGKIYKLNYKIPSKKKFDVELDHDFSNSKSETDYLEKKRCRAEARLIQKIISFKLSRGKKLSNSEKEYISLWKKNLAEKGSSNLVLSSPTSLSLTVLTTKDLEKLNQTFDISIDSWSQKYSLGELANFLDEITNDEIALVTEERIKLQQIPSEWKIDLEMLGSRSTGLNNLKKLYADRSEEAEWKQAQAFTQEEIELIKKIFRLGRDKRPSDLQMVDLDIESLEDFLKSVNQNEDREHLFSRCKLIFIK